MNELVEKVALAIALAPFDGNEAFIDMATNTKAGRARRLREAAAAIKAMRPEIEREIADWLRQPRVGMGYVGRCMADKIEAGEHRSKP
jgi:hypothetical protein